ncbi:hypothetical protein HYPSUDRAFT_207107 [Hypholoma sublateritium FD-334 SS-4]|uniref:Uncharacterized protein n=1 Tax=Hypholoma sublateritium (strain FD-334 SS-4) TaxID=945553 RepID=A0A0D2LZQ4_HYPSF|nr:hypothetical protein HYPSUDRAFT_207107 [Hypholoma sublateritium FD-334 SS-4]
MPGYLSFGLPVRSINITIPLAPLRAPPRSRPRPARAPPSPAPLAPPSRSRPEPAPPATRSIPGTASLDVSGVPRIFPYPVWVLKLEFVPCMNQQHDATHCCLDDTRARAHVRARFRSHLYYPARALATIARSHRAPFTVLIPHPVLSTTPRPAATPFITPTKCACAFSAIATPSLPMAP